MTNITVKLPFRLLDENFEAASRVFDMHVADQLAAAAELGDGVLLGELLDMVDWVDNKRHAAAASAQMN